jgi:hypothetical protein
MSLEEELRREKERTELERIKSAVREELADLESRIMTGITERIGKGATQGSSYDAIYSERQIQEVKKGVGNLALDISALSRSFNKRFPPRPEGRVRRVLQFVGSWYPVAIVVVLIFFVLAIRLHWPFFFGWFGYKLDKVVYPKDVRNVFLIP